MDMYLKIVLKAANALKWIWKMTVFLVQYLVGFKFSLNRRKTTAIIDFKSQRNSYPFLEMLVGVPDSLLFE